MNRKVYRYIGNNRPSARGISMKKAMNILLMIGIVAMICMPIVNAIQTDKIYVGTTGAIGGYNTYDYDCYRYGDYIVWVRSLDIYDSGGNVNPDGDTIDMYDPSWIMLHQISTGESWNITPDYDAGLKIAPNYYYHSQSPTISNNKILYEEVYGDDNWERTLYMYNISTDEHWQIPHGSLSQYTAGYEHMIYGDWIYFTHYGGGGRQIFVYNYDTGEGRRIDDGVVLNSNLGMNEDFMWFSDTSGSPHDLMIYSLETDKLTEITGVNVGYNIYASDKSSMDGLLGITIKSGVDFDSYIIDMEGMNITSEGGTELIYWENIAEENIIVVDTDDSYNSYAPYTDGNYAIYQYYENEADIMIHDIDDNSSTVFINSDNDEDLYDYYNTMILYSTNQNSFTHNNDATDDYDIYRSESETENIGNTITEMIPLIIIIMVIGAILGAFAMFGGSAGDGGML